ncbi:c-type cytochrome [Spirosoma sp. KCTC 42546]|uniref:c-type cytochrome n=1 Tax=Spirosoma sp. KCTC 42546 TaxID=2520506 RepID=UPI001158F8EF|nr:c-type cytochrome [Spirosoma sp. KCTC 42546]QDK79706.1 c-type cytochrome [Spirosoma sp. KCTC 42546]
MRQLTFNLFVGIVLAGSRAFVAVQEAHSGSAGLVKEELVTNHHATDTTANQISVAKQLIASSDCRACHNLQTKAVGPAYKEIAGKYKGDKSASERLARKVITGGNGVWGESSMSAHPTLSFSDATKIVNYILSLSDDKSQPK